MNGEINNPLLLPNENPPEMLRFLHCINRVLELKKGEYNHNLDENLAKAEIATVIPAYNEELTIGMVVLLSLQHSSRVIVVDDGSTDRTNEIAKLAGAEVIQLDPNKGKAFALRIGINHARDLGYHIIVTIDGNGLYNPNEIPYLTTLLLENEADIVIGTRFLRNPDIVSSYVFTDKYPGFVAYGDGAHDLLKDFLCRAVPQTSVTRILTEKGLRVAEIPITVRKKEKRTGSLKNVVIALPAYNEEKHIADVVTGALQHANTVLVVDDGSTDKTAEVAEEAGAIVIKHPSNQGYGAALKTIFSISRKMDAEALVTIDADGQHNPSDIKNLIKKLESGADVVIGSRFLEISSTIPIYRRFGMKLLDLLTTAAGVNKITDSQSGFRAYNKKAIQDLHLSSKGMSAGSEILIQISERNLNIKEIPINVRYDIDDTSTHNPVVHGISVFTDIFGQINYKHPIVILDIPAAFIAMIGVTILFLTLFSDVQFINSQFFMVSLSLTLIVIGSIIGMEGFIYNYYMNRTKVSKSENIME